MGTGSDWGPEAGEDDLEAREAEIVRSLTALRGRTYPDPDIPLGYDQAPPAYDVEAPAYDVYEDRPVAVAPPPPPSAPGPDEAPTLPARRVDRALLDLGALAVGIFALVEP